ncbi:hypothetical protein PybrP1_010139 [[Pythium] brassicae (nom. inval.)]|nr:hypothetical protein PybrP1_010139 [[Pythium] brassicae (nom. inval.)]
MADSDQSTTTEKKKREAAERAPMPHVDFAATLERPADGDPATYHVAGWRGCPFFQKTADVVGAMSALYPESVTRELHEFPDRDAFRAWLAASADAIAAHFGGADARAATHTSSPFVWANSRGFIGGCDDTLALFRSGISAQSLAAPIAAPAVASAEAVAPAAADDDAATYDFDLIVIGGGSGGLACSKEAAKFGKKVCVLDYVKPSPAGTAWGLGGTCVNVGCIPKKLMHQSALIGETLHKDSAAFGWRVGAQTFDWATLLLSVNKYIKSINFQYKVELRTKKVKYENLLGSFEDAHTLTLWHPKKGTKTVTARDVVIAVGGRPRPLACAGGELAISSDDIFWRKQEPGKTLVVGASYVALECAGFLKGMGYDVTVMVRSILLRGFDQDMAAKIGEYMETESQIAFIRGVVPQSIAKLESGQLLVKWVSADGDACEDTFDTVLNATGRDPDVAALGLDKAGVQLNPETGRVWVTNEQTSTPNIYAIGDVIDAPELTPVAIQAGRLLARRLYDNATELMDYDKVCTAVFTPIEYGCCGLSEEASIERLGEANVEVFHQNFTPLEWSLSDARPGASTCYVKVICDTSRDKLVVGFHYLGPNAGEVTQAIGLAMKLGFTYSQMVDVVGIHPTTAEIFTTLEVTKSSGESADAGGC